MSWLRVLLGTSLCSSDPTEHPYQILKHWEWTSNYEEYWDVWFCSTVMEVDTANDNHADRDDNSDAAGNSAADSTEEEQDNFDYKVDHISWCFVRVSYSSKQRIIRWWLGIGVHSFFIWRRRSSWHPLMCWYCAWDIMVGGRRTHLIPWRVGSCRSRRARGDSMFRIWCMWRSSVCRMNGIQGCWRVRNSSAGAWLLSGKSLPCCVWLLPHQRVSGIRQCAPTCQHSEDSW